MYCNPSPLAAALVSYCTLAAQTPYSGLLLVVWETGEESDCWTLRNMEISVPRALGGPLGPGGPNEALTKFI